MPDRIYTTYSSVVSAGAPIFHATLHYERTDSLGNVIVHRTIEGGPQNQNLTTQEKIDGVLEEYFIPNFGASRFGNIVGQEGPASLAKPTVPYETLALGNDLSSNWNIMTQYVSTFNDAGYAYRGPGQNSNTFITAVLDAGSLPAAHGVAIDPLIGSIVVYPVPGLHEPLNAPTGPGTTWTPVDGLQFGSVTEQDGSTTSTATLDPGLSGAVTKASIHTVNNIIDEIVTESENGAKKEVVYDIGDKSIWSQQTTIRDEFGRTDKIETIADSGGKAVIDFDQDSSKSWSKQTTETSASGQVNAIETVNDDGSYALRSNNTDGTHAITTGTLDGSAAASSVARQYDSADRVVSESFRNDDGSGTLVTHDAGSTQDWATQTAFFDLAHNLKSETINYDDGWQSVRVNDTDGAQSWSSTFTVTNAGHQLEWQDVVNDNGSGVEYGFNNSGAGDWTSYTANFLNGWQETSETDHYADGTRAEVTYDTAGQAWDYTANWYDPAGQLYIQDTGYDNGTSTETVTNTAGTDGWTSYTANFDANGNETSETDHFTDGSRAEVTFDLSGQNWDTTVAGYDPAGHLLVQDVNYDIGTSTETGYDTTGQEEWTSYTANYDAAGNETSERVYWDGDVGYSDIVWNGDAYTRYDYHPGGEPYGSPQTGTGDERPENFDDQSPVDYSGGDTGFYDGGFDFGDTPVVLDLDGNGVDIALRDASTAAFDLTVAPGREHTAWVAGNDGLLAIDLAANGQAGADGVIDQTREIVFTRWAPGTGSDLAALRAAFDTNNNGRLDAGDARFGEFRVWRDANRNGLSEAGELQTLTQLGIAFIVLAASGPPLAFADGSALNGFASYTRTDNTTGLAADVTFAPAGELDRLALKHSPLIPAQAGIQFFP